MRQLVQTLGTSHAIAALQDCAIVATRDGDGQFSLSELEKQQPSLEETKHKGEENIDPAQIQAVAVARAHDGKIWYAVARFDKSLALYCDTNTKPVTVHKLSKRAIALAFAKVSDTLTVIIAADLTGDANALSLDQKETTEEDDSAVRRLLVGHTASMLTGLSVRNDCLYTSDRDEKIRISSFPNTHVLLGYLLGHTAFVSCFDVNDQHVISGSGDGSVRLWDAKTQKELACYTVSHETSSDNEDNADDTPLLIPTSVKWDSSGKFVAVCYDQSKDLDLLQVQGAFLSRCCRIQCEAQPLELSPWGDDKFLVLLRDPAYASVYRIEKDALVLEEDTLTQKVRDYKPIEMPQSVLERDRHGTLKMSKESETRGPAQQQPWNDASRVGIARERNRRNKKRKRQRHAVATSQEKGEAK